MATQHSSAADSLVTVDERLSLDARQMYQSIADADATITAAFLASPRPPLGQLQRYGTDLATAHRDLSRLQAASGSQADGQRARQPGRRAVRLHRLRRRGDRPSTRWATR